MASSNRHWPSMFKSKPSACSTHHQWQHDNNPSLMSNGSSCHRPPYTTSVGDGAGCEERSPEPKPRWNPKPEQIRILEAIFNSGIVNPPRDEIRKIRAQLQEYGQVGDANVFYWFQNRKSRSKHKLRHQQQHHNSSSKQQQQQQQSLAHQTPHNPMITSLTTNNTIINAAPSSSSSSSEKSSPKLAPNKTAAAAAFSMELSNSPTASVNQQQTFFQAHHNHEVLPEPFFFPMQQSSGSSTGVNNASASTNSNFSTRTTTQGFCFSDQLMMSNVVHHVPHHHDHPIGPCTSLLLSEIMNHGPPSRKDHDQEGFKGAMKVMDQNLINYNNIVTTSPTSHATVASHSATTNNVPVPSPMSQIQGVGEAGAMGPGGAAKSTVFINDVAFEVAAGPFNVREAFGDDAVLIHSSGQPVLTNEWGVTLHPLHHGAFYYLI